MESVENYVKNPILFCGSLRSVVTGYVVSTVSASVIKDG